MEKETAYQAFSRQLLVLGREYRNIFRDGMRDALTAHTRNLRSAVRKQADTIEPDASLPQLLTIIPDVYIKEGVLAKIMQENGKHMPEHFLMKIRKEEKRTATLPYVILHLQNGASSLEYPENKINFLEQIFFFMYSGKFPPGDITYQKIIIA